MADGMSMLDDILPTNSLEIVCSLEIRAIPRVITDKRDSTIFIYLFGRWIWFLHIHKSKKHL